MNRPLCALCNRPVDDFKQEVLRDRKMVRFTISCHGDKQAMDFPVTLSETCAEAVISTLAFSTPEKFRVR